MILLLQIRVPPVLPSDHPSAVGGPAIARHLIGLIIRGGPVMRQFFIRLNVSHGDEHDLSLHTDIGVARVIAEDHPPFSLVLAHRADEEAIRDWYFR